MADGYVSRSFRANPTLPFYMALLYGTVGRNYVIGRIGQCLIGAATCLLIWRTAVRLAGREVGIVAGLLVAIYPPHIVVCGLFYVDCLLNFFLALSIYLCVRVAGDTGASGRKVAGLAMLSGIALGLTALTRPIFLLAIPCVGVAWLYAAKAQWRRQLGLCGLLLLGCAATILPWTLRNQRDIIISS